MEAKFRRFVAFALYGFGVKMIFGQPFTPAYKNGGVIGGGVVWLWHCKKLKKNINYYYYGEDEQNMAIAATQINSNTIIAKIYYIKEDGRRITNMHSQTSIIITNKS